jgi:hypothetical protein
MPKLHFNNGQERYISENELVGFLKRLANFNIRYFQSRENGDLIFMDNAGLAWMEREMPEMPKTIKATLSVIENPRVVEESTTIDAEEEKEKEDPAVKALREITEKSDCLKNGHKGKNQIIFKQNMKTFNKSTGKQVDSTRYFPVCEFCGLKGRFMAASKLSDEIRENAKIYEG